MKLQYERFNRKTIELSLTSLQTSCDQFSHLLEYINVTQSYQQKIGVFCSDNLIIKNSDINTTHLINKNSSIIFTHLTAFKNSNP